ncbi:MAG: hypothetical protein ABIP17_04530 [Ilumatobacteraceae bacterium]
MVAPSAAAVGRPRRIGRRVVVISFVAFQLAFIVRAYWAPHREFGYQMFPEASTWRADIVRVTTDGRRVPIDDDWGDYRWNDLAGVRGLAFPWREHHADAGIDNQLAFLDEALDWVATNTPDDLETSYLQADVTSSRNGRPVETTVLRSEPRDLP